MALLAPLNYYCQLTKSGAGVTGKAGSLTFALAKVVRGASLSASQVSAGGGITISSITEMSSSNQPGCYGIGFTGLDASYDYFGAFKYTGTASDVDLIHPPTLQNDPPTVAGGAVPQVAAGASAGLPLGVDSSGRVDVLKINGTSQTARDIGLALPAVAPGAANGLTICGSNAAATFATLTVTGAFSINGTSNVAQTGDGFARSGAPAGASIAADIAAVLTAVTNINNLSALLNFATNPVYEIPDSGTNNVPIKVISKNVEGKLVDLDGVPTVTAFAGATDRSANLSSVTRISTGLYALTYAVAGNATKESLLLSATGAESSDPRAAYTIVGVSDIDQATAIAAILAQTNKIATNSGDSPNAVTAQGNAATAATQATAAASSAATAATNTAKLPASYAGTASAPVFTAAVLINAPSGGLTQQQTADAMLLPPTGQTSSIFTGVTAAAVSSAQAAINTTGGGTAPTVEEIDTQLSVTHGNGLWGSGTDGEIAVNHNTGGVDSLRYEMMGIGINNAKIRAYLKSEYDVGTRQVRAESLTGSDGRWVQDMMLQALTYVITFDADGYLLAKVEVTVAS